MKVPLLDLKPPLRELRDEIVETVTRVIDSTSYIMGPEIDELEKENIPQVHTLMAAYPNPFNGSVRIPFKLASQITSSITIYNIIGQKVLEIPIKNYGQGDHTIVWDGRNQTGYNVGTGVYFVKLNVNTKNNYQKLIYLK